MANTLNDLMPKILARGLVRLRKRLVLPRLVNRDYSPNAATRGQVVNIPVPPSLSTRAVAPGVTPVAAPDITENTLPITLDQWHEVPLAFTDKDRVETIDESVTMAIDAAIDALAEKVNATIFALYPAVYNYVGTAGTTPFAAGVKYQDATKARKHLNKNKAPLPQRYIVVDPDAEENAVNLAEFADSSFSSDNKVILEGDLGRKVGFDWFMDQQVPTHTAGTLTGAVTVSGAHAAGVKSVTLAAPAGGAVALKKGDIITFAGDTQTYAVGADVNVAASATGAVAIEPGLAVARAGGEAVSVKASHVTNLAFHRDAFAIAIRPFAAPAADARVLTMVDPATGLPLRLEVTRQNKQDYWSFDLLWGVKAIRPELAVRIAG